MNTGHDKMDYDEYATYFMFVGIFALVVYIFLGYAVIPMYIVYCFISIPLCYSVFFICMLVVDECYRLNDVYTKLKEDMKE